MPQRYRRLRQTPAIRNLVAEHHLHPHDLIQPFFVIDGKNKIQAIDAMPGIHRFTVDRLLPEIETYIKHGGHACILFGVSAKKDLTGQYAYSPTNPVNRAIKAIKKAFPDFLIITDVCLCAYLTHGHCGIIKHQMIDNDASLPLLTKMALSHADHGADIVAPSDMMDFRIRAIREGLNKNGFLTTGIMSYAVKYASSYYGPFRDAAHSAPGFGDRKSYQMNPANSREALKEAKQDIIEGADMVMVKPALAYLDIVHQLRQALDVPVVAYNVSGEYSMIKAAAAKGWVNEKAIILESLLSMKRAGADIIITYHAKDVLANGLK